MAFPEVRMDEELPMSILIHGGGCIGKSTWAAGFPGYVGLCSEFRVGGTKFPHLMVGSWDELMTRLDQLNSSDHQYRTVGIDTADGFELMMHAKIANDAGKESISEIGYGKGYEAALTEWVRLAQKLDLLRYKRRMAVILIAHTIIKKFDAPDTEPYDRYRPNLHDKAATFLYNWVDACLFATTQKEAIEDKTTAVMLEPRRILYTKERPAFWAKSTSRFPFTLPLEVKSFVECIRNGQNKEEKAERKGVSDETTPRGERSSKARRNIKSDDVSTVESGQGTEAAEGESQDTNPTN